ncbi:MAG: nucleotidyltransferase family protein [Firmicutes bacterium]|nr:nucleotidyltransferase family protein [Bacillota bacterium]
MDAVGVVCEFDPLHWGHERLLRRAGESGRVLVCAMSGNFTQRGGAACVEKSARAEMAVRCGADLVVELPTPWAMATAEKFADGGVSLLAQCGVKTLYFGSECGDTDALWATAEALLRADVHRAIRLEMDGGLPYAAARQAVLERETGLGALLAQPNNTLAVEYLKAIRRRGLTADAVTVRREDGGHHGTASASHIRALLAAGQEAKAFALMPPQAADILGREMKKGLAPVDPARLERAMLARLRLMNEHDFTSYDSGGEGLYRRVYRAVQEGGSLGDILTRATTKRYPTARVRRMLWAVFLGLEAPGEDIPYVRILAATEAGRRLLRQMQDAGVPVLTKAADVGRLGPSAEALFTREARRTDVYALACPGSPLPCGSDWRRVPVMI